MRTTNESTERRILDVIDAHAGGDVGRVVLDGIGDLPAGTVAERARFLRQQGDGLRRLLIQKPHGDPSQCINLVVPPSDPDADTGLIIMGTMGYPDFSGSNAMCTIAALAEAGRLPLGEEERDVLLETPGGLTRLRVSDRHGKLISVAYDALPGFVALEERLADVAGWGPVRHSLVYGGVFYAIVSGADVGLDPARTPVPEMMRFFQAFLPAAARQELYHPVHGTMPPLSLALLAGPLDAAAPDMPSTHVAVYMDPGVICHGPTGTGTTALLAWLERRGEIEPGSAIRAISPFGNEFTGTLLDHVALGERTGVRTRISGQPRLLAHSRVIIDFGDPLIDRHGLEEVLIREERFPCYKHEP